jgi:hypothetical protein
MEFDFGKVLTVFGVLVAGVVLILTNDHVAGVSLITAVMGYTMGNGRLIQKGQDPVPMVRRRSTPPPPPAETE